MWRRCAFALPGGHSPTLYHFPPLAASLVSIKCPPHKLHCFACCREPTGKTRKNNLFYFISLKESKKVKNKTNGKELSSSFFLQQKILSNFTPARSPSSA